MCVYVCVCVCCLLPLSICHPPILWLSGEGHVWGPIVTPHPASSPALTVPSVRLTVVVVEASVAVLHVAVFGFFPLLAVIAFIFRLGLLFVTPLVLNNVLSDLKKEAKCWKRNQHVHGYFSELCFFCAFWPFVHTQAQFRWLKIFVYMRCATADVAKIELVLTLLAGILTCFHINVLLHNTDEQRHKTWPDLQYQ